MPSSFRQYRLRTLLLFCTLAAICFGLIRWRVSASYRQHQLANQIVERNGSVRWENWGPDWLNTAFGSFYFRSIIEVNMNHRHIEDDDLKLLREISSLEELNLSTSAVTDRGLIVLYELPRIRELRIDGTNVTNECLKYVGNLRKLESLNIQSTQITEDGLLYLRGMPNLTDLRVNTDAYWKGPFELTDTGIDHLSTLPSYETKSLRCKGLSQESLQWIRDRFTGNELTLIELQGDAWADFLWDHPTITHLAVHRSAMQDDQLRKMLLANRLTHLYLTEVLVSDAGLVAPEKLTRLKSMSLHGTRMTTSSLFAIYGVHARQLSVIEQAYQDRNASFALRETMHGPEISWDDRFQEDDWKLVEFCPHMQTVVVGSDRKEQKYYDFEGHELEEKMHRTPCQIDDEALEGIVQLPQLMELKLSGLQRVSPSGLTALVNAKDLWSLQLTATGITDEHLKSLSLLGNLKRLDLGENMITDDGMAQLESLQNLESLDVSDCPQLSDESLKSVAKLQRLSTFKAANTSFGDEGLKYLFNMPRLKELWLIKTKATSHGIQKLKNSLPKRKP